MNNFCGYFVWFDPPMQDRAREVINGLLRKLNHYERTSGVTKQASRRESALDTTTSSTSTARNANTALAQKKSEEITYKVSRTIVVVICVLIGTLEPYLANNATSLKTMLAFSYYNSIYSNLK
ncbi:hypothetical protein LINGRAHAP2_LOCUS7414, partial [Linum grandiflorum]